MFARRGLVPLLEFLFEPLRRNSDSHPEPKRVAVRHITGRPSLYARVLWAERHEQAARTGQHGRHVRRLLPRHPSSFSPLLTRRLPPFVQRVQFVVQVRVQAVLGRAAAHRPRRPYLPGRPGICRRLQWRRGLPVRQRGRRTGAGQALDAGRVGAFDAAAAADDADAVRTVVLVRHGHGPRWGDEGGDCRRPWRDGGSNAGARAGDCGCGICTLQSERVEGAGWWSVRASRRGGVWVRGAHELYVGW